MLKLSYLYFKRLGDSGLGDSGTRGLGDSGTRKLSHTQIFKIIFSQKILIVQIYYSTNVLLKNVQGDTKFIVANLTNFFV